MSRVLAYHRIPMMRRFEIQSITFIQRSRNAHDTYKTLPKNQNIEMRGVYKSIHEAGAGYSGAYMESALVQSRGLNTIGGCANARCIAIPTPSNTASRQAHAIAEFLMDRAPPIHIISTSPNQRALCIGPGGNKPRTARDPPVKNPAIIALQSALSKVLWFWKGLYFHGSSFCRILFTAQS